MDYIQSYYYVWLEENFEWHTDKIPTTHEMYKHYLEKGGKNSRLVCKSIHIDYVKSVFYDYFDRMKSSYDIDTYTYDVMYIMEEKVKKYHDSYNFLDYYIKPVMNVFKDARLSKGLTIERESIKLRIPQHVIEAWENEESTPPNYITRLIIKEINSLSKF